jgi:phosphoglycolate phosphatase-like HAD superfamily hydrolase
MYLDRQEFCCVAARKASAQLPGGVRAFYHVGDTPMDVMAAVGAGATAIGVTTGVYSRQQLEECGPADRVVVFDDLRDTASVLAALGLAG